jgi:hypothetical protein
MLSENSFEGDAITESDSGDNLQRTLEGHVYYFPLSWRLNGTNDTMDFDAQLTPPEDVSVDAVVSSLYFNTIIFICLMCSYEILRRLLPAVYSSRQRTLNTRGQRQITPHVSQDDSNMDGSHHQQNEFFPDDLSETEYLEMPHSDSSLGQLPDQKPLDWIGPVFGIPWNKVREKAGLDGYFFLR